MIENLKNAVAQMREAQMAVESDVALYKRIDDAMTQIETIIDELEGE